MNGSRRILTLGGAGFLGVIAMTFAAASCGGSSTATPGDGGAAGSTRPADTGTAGTSGTAGTTGTAGTAPSGTAGTSSTTGGPTTGPQGCTQAVTEFCARDLECVDTGATASDMADCVRQNGVALGCSRATTEDFKDCVSDLKALSCATLFPADGSGGAVASCSNQFSSIPPSTAETQCDKIAVAACEKDAQCDGPLTSDEMLQCESDLATALNCPFATDVGATFNQCLTDLAAAACIPADAGAPADGGSAVPSCDTAIVYVQ
jgi:hypothetical protein